VVIGLILLAQIGAGGLSGVRSQGSEGTPVISASLSSELAVGKTTDIVIQFRGDADYTRASTAPNWSARGEAVLTELFASSERSQRGVVRLLTAKNVKYESYPINNVLVVRNADEALVHALAKDPEVLAIRKPIQLQLDQFDAADVESLTAQTVSARLNWGIDAVNAPLFWQSFRMGEGIVVASIDSGVDHSHPALQPSYNCTSTDPVNKCWLDVTADLPSPLPVDVGAGGHGTHVMGIITGGVDFGTPEIGVAPAATWIACRAFAGNVTDETSLYRCGAWILAPDGDPANRPNVVNNSWSEISPTDNPYDWYREIVRAWKAAGILPVFSAGNGVGGCDMMLTPSSYPEVFTVGAFDSSKNLLNISKTGSDGLGTYTETLKPDLVAPGLNIYSSLPGGTYGARTGTSMAAPFASGAAALLMSCSLANRGNLDLVEQALRKGAGIPPDGSCGVSATGVGNYSYGYGYLDTLTSGLFFCDDLVRYYLPVMGNQ